MSHFTYEIDERNLRLQLKDLSLPLKDDAWQKFEAFADDTGGQRHESKLPGFSLNLSRNLILPSAFGVIIILCSFLLVNFVNIKNPVKSYDQKAEIKAVPIVEPAPAVKAEPSQPAVVKDKKAELPATSQAAPEMSPAPVKEPQAEQIVSTTALQGDSGVRPTQAQAAVISEPASTESLTTADDLKARRMAKRRAEALESEKLKEISPTPVVEDSSEEVRPN
jgi:hypothetical protein